MKKENILAIVSWAISFTIFGYLLNKPGMPTFFVGITGFGVAILLISAAISVYCIMAGLYLLVSKVAKWVIPCMR